MSLFTSFSIRRHVVLCRLQLTGLRQSKVFYGKKSEKVLKNKDNLIQNFHLGRYIIRFMAAKYNILLLGN